MNPNNPACRGASHAVDVEGPQFHLLLLSQVPGGLEVAGEFMVHMLTKPKGKLSVFRVTLH